MRQKSLSDWWRESRWKVRGYVPFTHWWLIGKKLDKSVRSILDLGCGIGKPMKFFNRHKRYYTVGVEGFAPDAERCRREHTHDKVLTQDIRKLNRRKFDVVLCLSVLEHLNKRDGQKLIKNMIRIARKQIIMITTIDKGVYIYKGNDGNRMAEHQHVWLLKELEGLKKYGFKIYGIGLRGWGGRMGVSRHIPEPFNWLMTTGLQFLLGGIMYFKPSWSSSVMLVRDSR